MSKFINQEDLIKRLLEENIQTISVFKNNKYKSKELTQMINDIYDIFKKIIDLVDKLSVQEWQQPKNKDEAGRARHDLYGNFTKINFTIEFIVSAQKDSFTIPDIKKLKGIIANDKEIYQQLRSIFY